MQAESARKIAQARAIIEEQKKIIEKEEKKMEERRAAEQACSKRKVLFLYTLLTLYPVGNHQARNNERAQQK